MKTSCTSITRSFGSGFYKLLKIMTLVIDGTLPDRECSCTGLRKALQIVSVDTHQSARPEPYECEAQTVISAS